MEIFHFSSIRRKLQHCNRASDTSSPVVAVLQYTANRSGNLIVARIEATLLQAHFCALQGRKVHCHWHSLALELLNFKTAIRARSHCATFHATTSITVYKPVNKHSLRYWLDANRRYVVLVPPLDSTSRFDDYEARTRSISLNIGCLRRNGFDSGSQSSDGCERSCAE